MYRFLRSIDLTDRRLQFLSVLNRIIHQNFVILFGSDRSSPRKRRQAKSAKLTNNERFAYENLRRQVDMVERLWSQTAIASKFLGRSTDRGYWEDEQRMDRWNIPIGCRYSPMCPKALLSGATGGQDGETNCVNRQEKEFFAFWWPWWKIFTLWCILWSFKSSNRWAGEFNIVSIQFLEWPMDKLRWVKLTS